MGSLPWPVEEFGADDDQNPPTFTYFEKSPSGSLNVLFPDPRITVQNPVSAGKGLRIPQGGASYKLDTNDVGTERVFVVASLDPISSLSQAVNGLQSGSPAGAPVLAVTQIAPASSCPKTRALSFDEDAPASGCSRERGLSLEEDSAGVPPTSMTAGAKPVTPSSRARFRSSTRRSCPSRATATLMARAPWFP